MDGPVSRRTLEQNMTFVYKSELRPNSYFDHPCFFYKTETSAKSAGWSWVAVAQPRDFAPGDQPASEQFDRLQRAVTNAPVDSGVAQPGEPSELDDADSSRR
jgi:hypothetical protein